MGENTAIAYSSYAVLFARYFHVDLMLSEPHATLEIVEMLNLLKTEEEIKKAWKIFERLSLM